MLNNKKGQEVKGIEIEDEQVVNDEPKVTKLTDWKQLKAKNNETTMVDLTYPDGEIISVEIKALSKATLTALDEKYNSMRKPKPEKVLDKVLKKWVPATEGHAEYIAWKNENDKLDQLKAAETMIYGLVNKPEGENIEEQSLFLQDVFKGGQFDNLFMEILKFSGYDLESKISEAKNS